MPKGIKNKMHEMLCKNKLFQNNEYTTWYILKMY